MRSGWGGGLLALLLLLSLLATACQQADRVLGALPRMVGRGGEPAAPGGPASVSRSEQIAELPPEQPTEGFDFERLDDQGGNRRFRVRLRAGGSPALVAARKLTPLFEVDGKNAEQYVSEPTSRRIPGGPPRRCSPAMSWC